VNLPEGGVRPGLLVDAAEIGLLMAGTWPAFGLIAKLAEFYPCYDLVSEAASSPAKSRLDGKPVTFSVEATLSTQEPHTRLFFCAGSGVDGGNSPAPSNR
jgi:hypothetical protein